MERGCRGIWTGLKASEDSIFFDIDGWHQAKWYYQLRFYPTRVDDGDEYTSHRFGLSNERGARIWLQFSVAGVFLGVYWISRFVKT